MRPIDRLNAELANWRKLRGRNGRPRGARPHTTDADCTLALRSDCCVICGVWHGDPCLDCGGRGYHNHSAGPCPSCDCCATVEPLPIAKPSTPGQRPTD